MKKLLLILFLFTGIVNAQIVNIPDANFKAKLLSATTSNTIASNVNPNSTATWGIYSKVDTNNDGEIQYSEAANIVYLNISGSSSANNGGITNLQGIEAFINLQNFNCKYNAIPTFDLGVCNSVKYFYCSYNSMSNLSLTNCSNLEVINCDNNLLTSLNTSQCTNLRTLVITNNQIAALNLDNNNFIETLYAYNNSLTSFHLQDKPTFRTIEVGANQLTTLELINLPHLYRVKAQGNNLVAVDLSTIAFEPEPNNLPAANTFDVYLNNNLNLNYINMKNGFMNLNSSLSSSNLGVTQQFICIDENDTYDYFWTTANPISNSYCSFTPNGNYNTITGSMIFDGNNDGCDAGDLPQPNIKLNINDGTNQGATFTNNAGNYKFYTQTGSFVLTPNVENPSYFTFSPADATIPFANNNNNTITQNFCIAANGVHKDLEISIAPLVPARPGFDAVYQIVYKNKGNQTLTQPYGVNFFYNQNLMTFVSATVTPASTVLGSLSWDYTNFKPFESRVINVTMHINPPTGANAVNIGDVLVLTANILATGDENNNDNLFQFNQTVVGSYDPNDITCIEGTTVSPSQIGNYLHYNINFENTGTYEAENIVVRVEINPADFDVDSLQMLASSNNAYVRITGNISEFIFENIMLDTGGHGNILLKIRSKNNLLTGDMVSKRADIFFDYNAPIDTGMASTTFQALSNAGFEDVAISVYPNPTSGLINIEAKSNIKSVQLFDIQGRLLQTKLQNDTATSIDISDKSQGVYFVKITSENGIKVEKIIKK